MSDLTRRKSLKQKINALASQGQNHLTINRYHVLYQALQGYYPIIYESVNQEGVERFIEDICYADRMIRYATQGKDKENKVKMSETFQLTELEREPNYHGNIKKLETL